MECGRIIGKRVESFSVMLQLSPPAVYETDNKSIGWGSISPNFTTTGPQAIHRLYTKVIHTVYP
jgi:hypothetical protein